MSATQQQPQTPQPEPVINYDEAISALKIVVRYMRQIAKPGHFPSDESTKPFKASSILPITEPQKKWVEDIAMTLSLYTPSFVAEMESWTREQASYFIDTHKAEAANKKSKKALQEVEGQETI